MKGWLLALAVLSLIGQTASAQRRSNVSDRITPAALERLIADYGDCVVARNHDLARSAVDDQNSNITLASSYGRLFSSPRCATNINAAFIRFPASTFKYVLADALFRLDYVASGPTDYSTVPALVWRSVPLGATEDAARLSPSDRDEYATAMQRLDDARTVGIIAECAVRANPVAARQLALSVSATASESAVFNGIRPLLSNCMVQGSTVRLGRQILRGSIVLAYVRLALASARVTPSEGTSILQDGGPD